MSPENSTDSPAMPLPYGARIEIRAPEPADSSGERSRCQYCKADRSDCAEIWTGFVMLGVPPDSNGSRLEPKSRRVSRSTGETGIVHLALGSRRRIGGQSRHVRNGPGIRSLLHGPERQSPSRR